MPQFPANIDLSQLDGANGFRLDGIDTGDQSGRAVSGAGDVNGDGFADLIVGAFNGDPGGDANAGESYVVFGRASGFAASLNLAALDGTNGFRIDGIDAGDQSGRAVSGAGDVNGDGFDDLIVGAPNGDPDGNANVGESYVIFGKAGGFAASLDPAALDGVNGFRLDGVAGIENSGLAVAAAGDVNGDGFDDVIVGAVDHTAGPNGQTVAFVVFGAQDGFAASLDLGALDGTNGFRFQGPVDTDFSGLSVSSTGDVNADGFDDVIVAAANGTGFPGEAYVVFGKASGFAATLDRGDLNGTNGFIIEGIESDAKAVAVARAGDVNGDGIGDFAIGAKGAEPGSVHYAGSSYVVFGQTGGFGAQLDVADLDGANGFRIDGFGVHQHTGQAVSGAGDVNGDGFDDLIIGAPYGDSGAAEGGESFVVFGAASGFGATLALTSLDGENGFRLDGAAAGDQSGFSVSGAGDVNNDGFADLIVGANAADPGGDLSAGASYVVFGIKPVDAVDRTGTAANQSIAGGLGADALAGLGGNDTLWGHENADTLNGGSGDDTMKGGAGNDTLTGGSGDDTHDGGSGDDAMAGGTGDDVYVVSAAGDTVAELVNQGRDQVRNSVSVALAAHVEDMAMTGAAAIGGTGNNLGNAMTGNGAANALDGLGGSDRLDGRAGADVMTGGVGNEIYWIDNAGDAAIELSGEGTDLIRSAISLSLAVFAHVENLQLTGAGPADATGSSLANALTGNNGANAIAGGGGGDTIRGGFGADVLTGGAGADVFLYLGQNETAPSLRDTIADFASGTDAIDVSAIDADRTQAGNQAFAIDGDGSFSTGEIGIADIGADLLVSFNTDADAAAEMQILLRNINGVLASYFLL